MAVGRGGENTGGPARATLAEVVLDDHRLAQARLQFLGDDARGRIRGAARSDARHEAYGPAGKTLRGGDARDEHGCRKQNPAIAFQRGHGLFSCSAFRSWASPAARQASRRSGFDSDRGGFWPFARPPPPSATLPDL